MLLRDLAGSPAERELDGLDPRVQLAAEQRERVSRRQQELDADVDREPERRAPPQPEHGLDHYLGAGRGDVGQDHDQGGRQMITKASRLLGIRNIRTSVTVIRQARVMRKVAPPLPGVGASSRRRNSRSACGLTDPILRRRRRESQGGESMSRALVDSCYVT